MIRPHRLPVLAAFVGLAALIAAPALRAQMRSPNLPAGTGSLAGRIVAGDTGKPLRRALVEIMIYGTPSGPDMSSRFAQAIADDQGRFTFDKLPAGRYRLAAQATGYIRVQYGQQSPGPQTAVNMPRTIDLTEGQAQTGIDFTLTPFTAIEGTVTDEFGDPAPNVLVQASQVMFLGGRRRLFPAAPNTAAGPTQTTDDRGHFRIAGLAPGTYYVEALSGAFADPTAAGGFAITYFPGTTDTGNARPVTLVAGHDATDTSFALAPAPSVPVAGTVVDEADQPIGGANLSLTPAVSNGPALFATVRSVSGPQGRFVFRNVPPGSYTLQAFGKSVNGEGNLGSFTFGYATFRTGPESANMVLRIPAPRALRGHISFDGDATTPRPHPDQVRVNALAVDFESAPNGGGPVPSTVHDDWTFEVLPLSGLRAIRASAAVGGWSLMSITIDGQDVTDTPLDFREHDINGAEIVLTSRPTTVTATLSAVAKDHTPSDYNVLLFGASDTTWTASSRYLVLLRPNQQGAFVTRGLPPGQYYAAVVGPVTQGEWQDPEYLRGILTTGAATAFSLSEGQSQTLALTVSK